MDARTRKRLLRKLVKTLSEAHAPSELLRPPILNLFMSGKLVLVSVKRVRPCACAMCAGTHEDMICAIVHSPEQDIETLFSA